MKKIVMIPLDERPCNYKYPSLLPKEDYEIILPSKDIMCSHKQGANFEKLKVWLLDNVKDADAVIISLDTLIFGGLVPSRLHHFSLFELIQRLDVIKEIKEINPKALMLGFELIMRCPSYSSDAEEPHYYAKYGKEIHRLGELTHLEKLGKVSDKELKELELLKKFIDKESLDDYLNRRDTNLNVLLNTLNLVKEGYFDYFVVPQDDASVYGYTALDQIKVREVIKSNYLHDIVSMYPSADDTGLSLIGYAVSYLNNYKPRIYVKYSSPKAPLCIPWFEDRPQDETIKYQILSVNGVRVTTISEADIVLCVNMVEKMLDKDNPDFNRVYEIERDLDEFISYIKYAKSLGKVVAIADTAFCNGSDPELICALSRNNLLLDIDTYAGWNTSSNTMGTTLSSAVLYYFGRDEESRIKFLIYRYYEDYGYMVKTRSDVTNNILPRFGLNYFDLKNENEIISKVVTENVNESINNDLPILKKYVKDIKCVMPWNRMFETDLTIEFKDGLKDEN